MEALRVLFWTPETSGIPERSVLPRRKLPGSIPQSPSEVCWPVFHCETVLSATLKGPTLPMLLSTKDCSPNNPNYAETEEIMAPLKSQEISHWLQLSFTLSSALFSAVGNILPIFKREILLPPLHPLSKIKFMGNWYYLLRNLYQDFPRNAELPPKDATESMVTKILMCARWVLDVILVVQGANYYFIMSVLFDEYY